MAFSAPRAPFAARRAARQIRSGSCVFGGDTESWGVEQKQAWIIGRLRKLTRRAYSETPYYKDLFDRIGFDPKADFTFEDFSRLPVLERDQVRNAGRKLIAQSMPAEKLQKDSTGGSTGTPTEIWIGPRRDGRKESCGEYFMQRLGVPTGKRTALLWGHHLDPKSEIACANAITSLKPIAGGSTA